MKRTLSAPYLLMAAVLGWLSCTGALIIAPSGDGGSGQELKVVSDGADGVSGGDHAPSPIDGAGVKDSTPGKPNPLSGVLYWAYQIQDIDHSGAVDALVKSRYDMLVLEPTRTDRNHKTFDTKGMVSRLHATQGASGKKRIVIAYLDIGEAESWRYYWKSDWEAPTTDDKGTPDFMIIPDPDGWAHNYPVAYWDPRWKDIIIHNKDSMLAKVLDDGFDGIYMDWVEAFVNKRIVQEAKDAGKDPAEEMIAFIREIRVFAQARNPNFLVIAQNASSLAVGRPHYVKVIDAIAQEQIFYDGDADTGWDDGDACDHVVPKVGATYSQAFYTKNLKVYSSAGLPIFNAEYACSQTKVKDAYTRSRQLGYMPYVSRRPLSRLTTDAPFGYY